MIKLTDGRPFYKQAVTGAIKTIKLLICGALIGDVGYILWSLGFVKSLILFGVLVALLLAGVALIFVYFWASDGGIMPRDYCDYCHDGDDGSAYPYYGLAPHIHLKSDGTEWTPEDDEPVTDTVMATGSELPENFQPDETGRSGIYALLKVWRG